jgi:hypothetical protein
VTAGESWAVFRPRYERRARILAAIDLALVVAFLVVYLLIIDRQGNSPAYWFVALLGVAALGALSTVVSGSRTTLLVNVAILGVCAFVSLLSVGILLVPAIATGIVGVNAVSRSRQP